MAKKSTPKKAARKTVKKTVRRPSVSGGESIDVLSGPMKSAFRSAFLRRGR